MTDLEPGIAPLVAALNSTGLVETFSSCEGHFGPDGQQLRDRNHAEVRFRPANPTADVETWLGTLLMAFKERHGLMPVTLVGYKLYTPISETEVDQTFVLELRPFNRFDLPATKRADIDRAIVQIVRLL